MKRVYLLRLILGFAALLTTSALFAKDPPGAKRFTSQLVDGVSINSVCFSPDGRYALSGSYDKTIKLWDVATRQEVRTFKGHGISVSSGCFSPDGRYALSGSYDKTIKLWEVATGKKLRTFKGHSSSVSSVCFSPDGRYALSGSYDETLKLWDVATGQEVRTFKGHASSVWSVCFSPDGRYILSGSYDKTIKLWDVATGQEVRTFKGHASSVWSVCFSPDGRYALSGSYDETLKLWGVATGQEVRTFKGHASSVNSVCFSPDGRYALSGSYDKTIKLWEVTTAQELSKWELNYQAKEVAFSPDGASALVGTDVYFVSFLLPGVAPKPQEPVRQQTAPVFSQFIWLSQPATVHEPTFTAKAVVVSNAPTPVTPQQLQLYINGKPQPAGQKDLIIQSLRQPQPGRYNWQQTLPLREGENEIVLGLTLPGQPEVRSEPLRITYLPPAKPNLYVLAIGVPGNGLTYASADAEQVGQLLKQQQGKLFNRVQTTYLNRKGQANATQLRIEMGLLPTFDITPNDVLLLFVSAHGKKLNLRNGQSDFAILSEDYDGRTLITEETTTLLYKHDILDNITGLKCKKLILFDACHSGEAVRKQGGKAKFLEDLQQAQAIIKQTPAGLITLASSSENELSWEDPAWQHGAFTKALLDGLQGKADTNGDRFVLVSELFSYLQKTVPALVKAKKAEDQHPKIYPETLTESQDFPLVTY
ncbi:caspase family protein [Spirosoma fluviale]|uniref:WD domain-containing protein, G-beta repeat-containing protein n=1 Tax=Spirosoma fluviale TaxID=1597977 RepID=A0A286GLM2_9BACT|nr:caspase family protein [Spirosoma fluviale]SOD96445.1 WD domain-containing protein, G-beta repeat-containing protein [Spirosoma fluviale]